MRINLRRYFLIFMISAFSVSLLSCNGSNVDDPVERSCSTADGLWTVVSAQCNGETVEDVSPVTYLFDQETGVVAQRTGRVDCATHFNWDVEIGEETPLFSMTGTGNLTCTASGQETDFCRSDVNACNAGIDITGIKNEFPTCVITADGMSLIRTVSPVNNPDSLSYCENGQAEVVQLVQGEYTPPEEPPEPEELIAFIEIAGPNPLDYGTHPVDARIVETLTLTNVGNAIATGLRGTGLASPFLFTGSLFPGTGGTCDLQLEVGASCTIEVEFYPLSAGYYTDNLLISYGNGSGNVTVNHGLAATASADLAQLSISNGPFFDFGMIPIGNPQTQAFTVTNNGGEDATNISEVGLAPPFQYTGGLYPGLTGDCGSSLAAGATCQLVLEFAPVAEGPFNDLIEIQYDDGVNIQTVRRNIFGQGVTP